MNQKRGYRTSWVHRPHNGSLNETAKQIFRLVNFKKLYIYRKIVVKQNFSAEEIAAEGE